MAPRKKTMGELLDELADACELSQTEIARHLDVPPSQLNRYFRGHNDIYADHLVLILRTLGIDLEKLIRQKIETLNGAEVADVETVDDCVNFLFRELDEIGRQTYLNSLLWAARLSRQRELPRNVEDLIRKRMSLI